MPKTLPSNPSLENLRKQAKTILKSHASGEASVCETLRLMPRFAGKLDAEILKTEVSLQEVQHALALDYGYKDWKALADWVAGHSPGNTSTPFTDFADLAGLDDLSLQLLLLEVDTRRLIEGLSDQPADIQDRFLKNMSRNAADLIREGFGRYGPYMPAWTAKSRKLILDIANILKEKGRIPANKEQTTMENAANKDRIEDIYKSLAETPASRMNNRQLIGVFKNIMGVALKGGLVVLDDVPEKFDDRFIQAGLRLVIDGTDTSIVREILEAKKKTVLADQERRMDLVISAVQSLSSGDHPHILEAKCLALLPSE
jgi:hypothetical protein